MVEVALFSLLARGLLGIFIGKKRHANVIYQVFGIIVGPVVGLMRWILPAPALDHLARYLPSVAFLMLLLVWFALTIGKIYLWKLAVSTL